MAAIATRNSSRMQAQQGVFTISHRDNIFVNNAGEDPKNHIWKYNIPAEHKSDLLSFLFDWDRPFNVYQNFVLTFIIITKQSHIAL